MSISSSTLHLTHLLKRFYMPIKPRQIRRQQVRAGLLAVAAVASLSSACGNRPDTTPDPNLGSQDNTQAVYYETVEQCRSDLSQMEAAYAVALQEYNSGKSSTAPEPLMMKSQDCDAQMSAAHAQYLETAPVYSTLDDCQYDGVACQPLTDGSGTVVYNSYIPVYGGSYFYPLNPYQNMILFGGRSVYPPTYVFRSRTPGMVVTSNGAVMRGSQPGRVTVPSNTQVVTPTARPKGTAARGEISGRSSQGIGSTYKGTGSGGK
jgi:hypothetical protein